MYFKARGDREQTELSLSIIWITVAVENVISEDFFKKNP